MKDDAKAQLGYVIKVKQLLSCASFVIHAGLRFARTRLGCI
jgi:hypothetical protein